MDIVDHTVLVTKNHQRIPIDHSGALIYSENKKLAGVIFVFRDVSKRIEKEEIIRTERDKFQSIISAITDCMIIIKNDFTIEYQNDPCIERIGNRLGKKCHKVLMGLNKPCDFCQYTNVIQRR